MEYAFKTLYYQFKEYRKNGIE